MGQIRLNGMEFYAYHGCYPEEQVIGNHFLVDITMDADMEKVSASDDLNDALNYAEVYKLVEQEMAIRAHLLEHVSARILNKLFDCFPQLNKAEVCVAKLNPPIGGKIKTVCVSQQRSR